MDTNDAWHRSRLSYLRGLRRPTKEQRQLLELVEKGELNSEELRHLEALWAVERAAARLEDAKVKSRSLIYRERVSARKERNHKLIQLGLLVSKANLGLDHGLALGALLDCSERIRQPGGQALADRWKTAGDQAIAEWERSTAGLAKLPGVRKLGE